MDKNLENLLLQAKKVARHSYSPYSNYKVGCAVSTDKGIFLGVNVENASSNLGICAERVAISNAITNGASTIEAVAVFCLSATKDSTGNYAINETMPCGGCRQWISELSSNATIVTNGLTKGVKINDLLPMTFRLNLS